MKITTSNILCAVLLLFVSVYCNSPKESLSTLTKEQVDSVKTELDNKELMVNNAWRVLFDEDKEKIFLLKRLLQEISYTPEYDQVLMDSLTNQIEMLESMQFDTTIVDQEDHVNKYDALTSDIVEAVFDFAEVNPKFEEYVLMGQLISEIKQMDDRVLLNRVKYDDYAIGYNEYLEVNDELFAQADSLRHYPTFEHKEN